MLSNQSVFTSSRIWRTAFAMAGLLICGHAFADGNSARDQLFVNALNTDNIVQAKAQLAAGTDINGTYCKDPKDICIKLTPLEIAVAHPAVIRFLIEQGADVKQKTDYGFTALHMAASEGKSEVIELLVQHGADVNAKSQFGQTPLYQAVNLNKPNNVETLLRLGADPNPTGGVQSLLSLARKPPRSPLIAAALVKAGATEEIPGGRNPEACEVNATPAQQCEIWFYARNGHSGGIIRSLDRGLNIDAPDNRGLTPLMLALQLPRSVNDMAPELRNDASYKRHVDSKIKAAQLLIDRGANLNLARSGITAVHIAAHDPRLLDILRTLIAKGAKIDVAGEINGVTPLLTAVEVGNTAAAEVLLKAGANPNQVMQKNISPLSSACAKNNLDMVTLLLGYKADPEIADDMQLTPLQIAIGTDNEALARILLKAGANPDNAAGGPITPRAWAHKKGGAIDAAFSDTSKN